jgi:hypothetical protein
MIILTNTRERNEPYHHHTIPTEPNRFITLDNFFKKNKNEINKNMCKPTAAFEIYSISLSNFALFELNIFFDGC